MSLLGIYFIGILQFFLVGSQSFWTGPKIIYIIGFCFTLYAWFARRCKEGDLASIYSDNRIMMWLMAFMIYMYLIVPINGIRNGASYAEAFRGITRLINIALVFVIYSEIKDQKQAWHLYIFITLLSTAICIRELGFISNHANNLKDILYLRASPEYTSISNTVGIGLFLPLLLPLLVLGF